VDPFTTAALTAAAGRALSRLAGQQLADRLAELAHLQRAEMKMLNELNRRLDHILAAPFRAAGRLLEDAGRPNRSDADRLRLLHEARESLTLALAQDDDPFRLSMAALLLAAVWVALDYPDDAALRIRESHEHAIEAAGRLADKVQRPAAPSRPGRAGGRMLTAGMPPFLVMRANLHGRPRSLRIEMTNDLTVFGRTFVRVEQYAASEPALNHERELMAFDEYVCMLRKWRISFGEDAATIPIYRVAVSPGIAATTRSWGITHSVTLYGLTYTPIELDSDARRPAGANPLLSDQMTRVQIRFMPNRDRDHSS
jgi:hypothetical protein